MKSVSAAGWALLALGCAALPEAREEGLATPAIRVTRIVPDLAAWDSARATDPTQRIAEFRQRVLDRHPTVYGGVLRVRDDSALSRYLDWLVPRLQAVYRIEERVLGQLPVAARNTAAIIPELATAPLDIVVGISLGETNGTVRLLDGRPVMLVGADVQTVVSESEDHARALLEHELVHVAHARVNPAVYAIVDAGIRGAPTPLYISLFSEGLAVWGSRRADATLTPEHVFMSQTLEDESRDACPRVLPLLRDDVESSDPRRYADWFFLSGRDPRIPRRFGYFAGARIVDALSASYSATQLLRMDTATILHVTRSILEDAAAVCGAPRSGQ